MASLHHHEKTIGLWVSTVCSTLEHIPVKHTARWQVTRLCGRAGDPHLTPLPSPPSSHLPPASLIGFSESERRLLKWSSGASAAARLRLFTGRRASRLCCRLFGEYFSLLSFFFFYFKPNRLFGLTAGPEKMELLLFLRLDS